MIFEGFIVRMGARGDEDKKMAVLSDNAKE